MDNVLCAAIIFIYLIGRSTASNTALTAEREWTVKKMNFEPYIKIMEEARIAGTIETMLYEFEQKHGPIESETLWKIKRIFEEKEK